MLTSYIYGGILTFVAGHETVNQDTKNLDKITTMQP